MVTTDQNSAAGDTEGGEGIAESGVDCDVSLYLRASPTTVGKRRQERIEERLQSLADEGRVDSLSVEHWPGQVTVGDEEPPIVLRYEELAAAADEAGARLAPFFDDRESVTGLVQGPSEDRIITLPVVAIVIEQEGRVVGLYPCHREGVHHRAEEAIDLIEAGTLPDNLAE